eukprot:COSAG03_NODE_6927_length_986_cov_1.099211_2_plen_96_part_01
MSCSGHWLRSRWLLPSTDPVERERVYATATWLAADRRARAMTEVNSWRRRRGAGREWRRRVRETRDGRLRPQRLEVAFFWILIFAALKHSGRLPRS